MTSYLVFDTNALPVKGNFESSFWAALFHLCRTTGVEAVASEVSVDEAVNLRRETAGEAVADLFAAHSRLSNFTTLALSYVPTAEEVAKSYEKALRSRLKILPLEGSHAVEAFRREALRITPARNGVGGRDSAIWLTIASLVKDGHEVHFVTNNTKDFGKNGLHPDLEVELLDAAGQIHYYHSANEYLSTIAAKVASPPISSDDLKEAFADSIRGQCIALLEEVESADYTVEKALSSSVAVDKAGFGPAYVIDAGGLMLVSADVTLVDTVGGAVWASGKFTGWLSFNPNTQEVEPSEVDDLNLNFRFETPAVAGA
ncbi:PIN domain-containing protein [Curtobacterium flaccumfaciens]|uniref:PIN domain-containing protein n=1 Tax=Curtobacterium flaccumfaciens TaxID=2035 RepID=UPI001127A691|nr:PIN domain-containing protein [Curtobacterium flaccumfaciens]